MKENMTERELAAILEASNDNIVIADGRGKVLRASPNCFSIYGMKADELIGMNVDDLEKMDVFSPSVTRMVMRQKKEVQLMQHTLTGRTVMATAMPVFDSDGDMIRIISFSHDLTELRQLKEDYEELRVKMQFYQSEIQELKEQDPERIVLKSKEMTEIWQLIQRVAPSDATVVFLGESGVGKNVFARAIHEKSNRREEAFIEVNCGAIPETLFESEMFGYEKGAFTGADKAGKPGLIELANKGTLFLDEVGELPLSLQTKLLKVIQEKKMTRIGGTQPKEIDFRIIVSTNRDLEEMVAQGTFRQDLYYRLNVVPIRIPPLREREDDLLQMSRRFLDFYNEKYGTDKVLDVTTIHAMMEHSWPGNVRELENLVERLVITTDGRVIDPHFLPFFGRSARQDEPREEEGEKEEYGDSLHEALAEVEKRWLKRASRQYKTTYEMAAYLGISQSSVVRKLKKYGINS